MSGWITGFLRDAQFVGNPYVWGGTSLTRRRGLFRIRIIRICKLWRIICHTHPEHRQDAEPESVHRKHSREICSSMVAVRGINHVAIYIGNGQVVHASSPSTGIKISNAYYRSSGMCCPCIRKLDQETKRILFTNNKSMLYF